MTKNAAAKKAARAYARANRTSYAAGRRLTRADDPAQHPTSLTSSTRPLSVWVTYEFTGPGAPTAFRLDATWWLEQLPWHLVVMLEEASWVYDPSGPDALVRPRDLLGLVADQDPEPAAAAAWVDANTLGGYVEVNAHDPWSSTGETTVADAVTTYPYQMVFDATAAQRWLDGRGPMYHLTLSDLVTPAERREWLDLHEPGRLDCSAGRHLYDGSPSPEMGECSGCGAMMLVKHTYDGDEYESVVDEEEFFAEAVATEAFCNWAPPTVMLAGQTQAEWHERNRRPFAWG
jgi:hypothetical protein